MKRATLAILLVVGVFAFMRGSALYAASEFISPRVPNTPEVAIARDAEAGAITRKEAAAYLVYDTFRSAQLPAKYRTGVTVGAKACMTPRLMQVVRDWNELPEEARRVVPAHMRPDVPRSGAFVTKGSLPLQTVIGRGEGKTIQGDDPSAPAYDRTYATTSFLFHWSSSGINALVQNQDGNSNGIPDMVEYAGQYMETTWTWFAAQGYTAPPGTDQYYYNVYFEYMPGYWGYCMPIDSGRISRSFLSLSSDFAGGSKEDGTPIAPADEMRVTSSHEFFHAVQFGYDMWEDIWWMEATATWCEDVIGPAWDAVNDYVWWVGLYLYYPEVSLDADYWSGHWYADCIWPIYLQSHIDADGSIVREIWEECRGTPNAMDANKIVIQRYVAGGFRETWLDFLVANYEQDYPEAAESPISYGDLFYVSVVYTYPTGTRTPVSWRPEGLGANYVLFYVQPSGLPDLDVFFESSTHASSWLASLMGKQDTTYTRRDFSSGQDAGVARFTHDYDEAVLVVSPTLDGYIYGDTFAYSFSAELRQFDVDPPTPNPLTWLSEPHAASTSSVAMTASTATDAATPPVTYRFDEVTGTFGGTDSAWQASSSYTDSSLTPNTRYGYRAAARDSAPAGNTTGWSTTVYVYTLCNVPVAAALSDPSPTKMYITLGDDGNPAATLYAVRNQTLGNYVQGNGSSGATAYFATRAAWSNTRMTGLAPATSYTFTVKAKNGDGAETALGPGATLATLPSDTAAPIVSNGAIVPTFVKEYLTTSATLLATASDRSTGGSDIVAAEYQVGVDHGAGSGTAAQAADGAFDSPLEGILAMIDTSSWRIVNNPYDIYVRAQDEMGFWSAPEHLVVNVVDGIPPEAVTDLSATTAAPGIDEEALLSVDSATSEAPGHAAEDAIDSNPSTCWATAPSAEATSEELTLTLDKLSACTSITLVTSDRADLFPGQLRVKVGDGTDWWTVVSEYDYAASPGANSWQFAPREINQVKIVIDGTPLDSGSGLYTAEIAEVTVDRDVSGERTVDLSWTAPFDIGATGRAATYVVKFSDNPALMSSFNGSVPGDTPPAPDTAGTSQEMEVTKLDPDTTYYFALKGVDQYDNVSGLSNVATAATLPDTSVYVALDGPADQSDLDVWTAPTFRWHANRLDSFKVQFSNVPSFPTRAYEDGDGHTAKTYSYGVRRGLLAFTPSAAQWKAIKKLVSDMEGTLYWRVEAKASNDRLLGVWHSEVFNEYAFDKGIYSDIAIGPYHDRGGVQAVWPDGRPLFVWEVSKTVYGWFYIDFSASPDVDYRDRKNTLSFASKNYDRTWFRPTPGQWKLIKKRFANVNGGTIYWRLRGFDPDKAFSYASYVAQFIVDSPTIELRKPGPRHDGSVMPGEVFSLDWNIDGEGYPYFEVQASTDPGFPKGRTTIILTRTKESSYNVTSGQVKAIGKLLDAAGTDTFLWRVIVTDVDRTMSVPSEPQSVLVSETPIAGGS